MWRIDEKAMRERERERKDLYFNVWHITSRKKDVHHSTSPLRFVISSLVLVIHFIAQFFSFLPSS
jgi:hypothetical protein